MTYIETAEKLASYSISDIRPIVPTLLEWLQDMNWPVARPVSEYLVSNIEFIETEILSVFDRDDEIWKYWMISVFGPVTSSNLLLAIIERIATAPTESEKFETLDTLCQEVLRHRNK